MKATQPSLFRAVRNNGVTQSNKDKDVGWQSKPRELRTKARIRKRDRHCCVVCGISSQSHRKRFGKTLDVHRNLPGSDYSEKPGDCVTLCDVCHDGIHGKGHWGWVVKDKSDDEGRRPWAVRRSTWLDVENERKWRRQAHWGAWLQHLRNKFNLRNKFANRDLLGIAHAAGVSKKTVQDWEAGRILPTLFEAKALASVLDITIDQLASEEDSEEHWLKTCLEESDLRAVAFGVREIKEGEALTPGAAFVREVVNRANEERREKNQARRMLYEKARVDFLRKSKPIMLGKKAAIRREPQKSATGKPGAKKR